MILVFFICLILFGVVFSKISIEICELKINNDIEKINTRFLIKIKTELYGVFPITILRLTQNEMKILNLKLNYESVLKNKRITQKVKTELTKVKKDFNIESIKRLNPTLEKIDLDLNLGTESFLLTTLLILGISTLLSFGIQNTIKKFDENKYKYIIKPDYNEKNKIILDLKGVLKIKTSNIIECLRFNYVQNN